MGVCSCCCKCVGTICCCIFAIIMILIIAAVVLLCVFLIPRTPKYEVELQGMDDYVLRNDYFWMNVTYTVELKNRNYYSAKIEDSKVRIYHRDDLIGSPSVSEAEFPSRKDTSRSVTLIVSTTNQTVIDAIIAEQPTKYFRIRGYLRAKYGAGSKKMDLEDNFQVPMTTSG